MPHHIIFWCKTTGNFFTECAERPSIIFDRSLCPVASLSVFYKIPYKLL
uniref:Uncharacterized protein n=1 Tax=Anguilla anguilla TaxID=7936 RepID=A0A0E9TC36_ANGAN